MSFGPWLGRRTAEQWTSPVSPHVIGRYEQRSADDAEQHVQCLCTVCKARCRCRGICGCPAEFHVVCTTGQPRQHIARFAIVHYHRDPMAR